MAEKPDISITIIGHNEADHLRDLLPTLQWAGEVIYVDCESQDDSLQIAQQFGCQVFSRPNNPNLNVNKTFALEKARCSWIFYIDPDERMSTELIQEIQEKITNPSNYRAFSMNRRNHYFGKWLKHGSQYPDVQLRLFQKGFAHFPQRHVHEKLQVDGQIGKLNGDLLHYPYSTISQYLKKFDFYTTFEAEYLYQQGFRPGIPLHLKFWFFQPFTRFMRRYIFRLGFRDGWPGFFAALFDALNFMVRYFKLIEITRQKGS